MAYSERERKFTSAKNYTLNYNDNSVILPKNAASVARKSSVRLPLLLMWNGYLAGFPDVGKQG